MEIIEKIRKWVKSQMEIYWEKLPDADDENPTQIQLRDLGQYMAYENMEIFLSTLESEEPTLTWGDVQLLDTCILECAREEREGKDWGESEEFYTEVLRRYNDFVKRIIPETVSKIHEYNENDRKDSPEN